MESSVNNSSVDSPGLMSPSEMSTDPAYSMNISNSANKSLHGPIYLYDVFYGSGFNLAYVWLYHTAIFALITIALNASLIYVTVKCRTKLNGPFNTLIAFDSLVSLFFSCSFLTRAMIPLSGVNYITASLCFYFQFPTTFGIGTLNMTMAFIGIERCCCVIFPLWSWGERNWYVNAMMVLSIAYGLLINVFMYRGLNGELKDKEILCHFADFYAQGLQQQIFIANMVLEAVTIGCYLAIWMVVIRGMCKRMEVANAANMQVIRSLTVIMFLIIFGWTANMLKPFIVPMLNIRSQYGQLNLMSFLSDLMVMAAGSNGPVLYMFSKEYREQYRKTFTWLRAQSTTTTSVQAVSNPRGSRP